LRLGVSGESRFDLCLEFGDTRTGGGLGVRGAGASLLSVSFGPLKIGREPLDTRDGVCGSGFGRRQLRFELGRAVAVLGGFGGCTGHKCLKVGCRRPAVGRLFLQIRSEPISSLPVPLNL
jgi:hypothetical protein